MWRWPCSEAVQSIICIKYILNNKGRENQGKGKTNNDACDNIVSIDIMSLEGTFLEIFIYVRSRVVT